MLEIVNGTGAYADQLRQFIRLECTELRGELNGPLASLRLPHAYESFNAQCDHTLKPLYGFPLPDNAAVMRVHVGFGQVEIGTELHERQQAGATYQEAKRRGH